MKRSRLIFLALIAGLLAPGLHAADDAKPGIDVVVVPTPPVAGRIGKPEETDNVKPVISTNKPGLVTFLKDGGQTHLTDRLVLRLRVGPSGASLKLVWKF